MWGAEMITEDTLREGKRQASEMVDAALRSMKATYGNLPEHERAGDGGGQREIIVTNRKTLARALNRDAGSVTRRLSPTYSDRFDEREIEIIVEKLEMSPSQRIDLRRWYGYESALHNLPEALTSFVGRDWARNRVQEEFGRTRLLTITGVGGCGKTRLSVEYARGVLSAYPDGVWFIDLARLGKGDDALAPAALASVLKVRELPGMTLLESIVRRLAKQRILILLDNCEHLATGSAVLAGALLRGATGVKLLATSRQPLGVAGERVWSLNPLDLPEESAAPNPALLSSVEAVRLFVERAQAARAGFARNPDGGFTLSAANAPAVVKIVRRLEGIPLALELAAARLRVLSPAQLEEQLTDPIAALGRPTPAPERQQTLEHLFDWSYDLLTPEEQQVFRRLAIFAGGWTLRQATAVCAVAGLAPAAVASVVEDLVDKSLTLIAGKQQDEVRFHMLETVRAFAVAKLRAAGEEEAVAGQHCTWFVDYVAPVEAGLNGPHQAEVLEDLTHEQENVRAARRHAIATGDSAAELALAVGMWKFWQMRGRFSEGRRALTEALARGKDEPPPLRAKALNAAGILATEQGDLAGARALTEESIAIRRLIGDRLGVARSLLMLGRLARMQGDWVEADRCWSESLSEHEQLGEKIGLADALANRGIAAAKQGDYALAESRFTMSMALLKERHAEVGIAMVLDNQGSAAMEQGAYAEAREKHGHCLAIGRRLEIPKLTAAAYDALGRIAYLEGDYHEARALHTESLMLRTEQGDTAGIATCQCRLADVAARLGELTMAREWCSEGLEITRATGNREGAADALLTLAFIALREGSDILARERYQESLEVSRESHYLLGTIAAIEGVARIAAGNGNLQTAARLVAATCAARERQSTPLSPNDRDAYADLVAHLRGRLGDAGFACAWAEGGALALEEAAVCAAAVQ